MRFVGLNLLWRIFLLHSISRILRNNLTNGRLPKLVQRASEGVSTLTRLIKMLLAKMLLRRYRESVTRFFAWISFPPATEFPIRTVSNFFEKSRRYSQVKVYRYQKQRRQICHRYQRHWRQILPPVSLVLLIPVANYGNSIRLMRP